MSSAALVVTSIQSPTAAMKLLAEGCRRAAWDFYVVGDVTTPKDFALDHCRFVDVEAQRCSGFKLAERIPLRHYSRKNLGYLFALRDGAQVIVETDDDNHPLEGFFDPRDRWLMANGLAQGGWSNVYQYFGGHGLWPRGFPLELARKPLFLGDEKISSMDCPIQQGLCNNDPDVDAVYRMLHDEPVTFSRRNPLALNNASWCPFNSQNTSWWRDALPLAYLPSHCSFRMTDIWRSFVAQRVAWACNWSVAFTNASVEQIRNPHDLLDDFRREIPGYLENGKIIATLEALELDDGVDRIGSNMLRCYEALVALRVMQSEELVLLEAWLEDLALLRAG